MPRYVQVPVPSEHVLEVMRWVLFRTPDDESEGSIRVTARLRVMLDRIDELQRNVLLTVVKATIEDRALRLIDAADELGQDASTVQAAIDEVNRLAFAGDRDLLLVRTETAVGVHSNRGKIAYLTMRPDEARLVRSLAKTHGAPAE